MKHRAYHRTDGEGGTLPQGKQGTPAWVWVGLGCLVAVLAAVSGIVAVGWFGYQKIQEVEAEMRDPASREAAVLEILGTSELPEGYHPLVGLSVPFLMRVAILTDRAPQDDGRPGDGFDERGFIFVEILQRGTDRDELRDFFEGRTDDPQVLRDHDIRIRTDEIVDRGTLDTDDATLLWVATRGRVEMARNASHGLTTLMLFECRNTDSRGRLGIWFAPDPAPDATAEELDRTGTPADPDAVRELVEPFSVCPA